MNDRHSVLTWALSLVAAATMLSCASGYKEIFPTLVDGKYDSEFPYRGCSAQLEEIGESVKMVNTIAYYRTFAFDAAEGVRPAGLTSTLLRGREGTSSVITNQASGTATVISVDTRRVVLLTCAHVIAFPDTVFSYFIGPDRRSTGILRTVAVKEKQTTYVAVFPEGGELQVLVMDKSTDVALLGKTFETEPFPRIRPFNYPMGRAKELEWGSFVYLFGYPTGYKMVTKGIVSSPNKDRRGGFMIDAVFNRGFSGGIALAVRDGVPNFELVGIVKLVSGRSAYVLTPSTVEGGEEYESGVPYSGDVYVERRTEIEYGLAQAVSIETILDVVAQNGGRLAAAGYTVHLGLPSPVP
ncbi:MAG: serine protease [Bacteroidota bacterium]